MYRYPNRIQPRRSWVLFGAFVLALVFVLAACGTNTTGGSQSSVTPTATPTSTPTPNHLANANGCPNNTVVTTPPAPASVILTNKNSGNTVSISKGETVEVYLPFGMAWSGPANLSQNLLSMQSPAGYASSTANACVWRFVAVGTGTAQLAFVGRPICKKGQLCPMYIMAMPFTVEIK